jgi:hypothetical protein
VSSTSDDIMRYQLHSEYLLAMMPQRRTTKEIKEMLRFYKQVAERIEQRQNDQPFGRILKQWRDRRARKGGRRG